MPGCVNRAFHTAPRHPLGDFLAFFFRLQVEGDGEEVGMQGNVVGAYAVPVEPLFAAKEGVLKSFPARCDAVFELSGVIFPAEITGHDGHEFHCLQVEGVYDSVAWGEDVTVALLLSPIDDVLFRDINFLALDQAVVRSAVDATFLKRFPEMDGDLFSSAFRRIQFEIGEGYFSKIHEDGIVIRSFDIDRLVLDQMDGGCVDREENDEAEKSADAGCVSPGSNIL